MASHISRTPASVSHARLAEIVTVLIDELAYSFDVLAVQVSIVKKSVPHSPGHVESPGEAKSPLAAVGAPLADDEHC